MGNFLQNLIIPRYSNNYFPFLLRKRFLTVITIGVLSFNIATGGGQLGAFAGDISSTRLIELTNQERAAAGLNQLRTDARLASAAQAKANNMFQLQYWAHYGPNGETPWQFILAAGYSYVYAGENLAKGFSSSEAVHSAWMASQTHRENILKTGYQDIGIAVVEGNLMGTDVVLVVQMFGSLSESQAPAPVPPVVPPAETVVPPNQGGNEPIPSTPTEESFVEITSPSQDERLADKSFKMTGKTNESSDSVIVDDGGVTGEGTVGEDGIWDYRPEGDWKEGSHNVTVWDDEKKVSSSVAFEIDTTPPVIDLSSIVVEPISQEGIVSMKVKVDESAKSVLLVAGERSMSLEKLDSGEYSLSISGEEILGAETLKLVTTDDLGNASETDLKERADIQNLIKPENNNQTIVEQLGNLGNADMSRLVTRGVVVVVALLLIIDAAYLYKLNIIHTRGKSLFPMALWILLMTIGIVAGRGGNIL